MSDRQQTPSTPATPAPGGRLEFGALDGANGNGANPLTGFPVNGAGGRASYGYGSNVLGDTEVHLLDYVKVLYKRRWTAATAFLVVFVSVAVYTFTATPIYEAKTQILIEKENARHTKWMANYDDKTGKAGAK